MRATFKRLVFAMGYFYLMGANTISATPVNDDPCGATSLAVTETCTFSTFDNNLATSSAGAATPGCGNYAGGDVWFSVQMPNNGYHINVDFQSGTLSDLAVAVYEGTDCNNLNLVSCDDNSGSGNMPSLTIDDGCLFEGANSTYWIRVWDEGGDESGDFDICVSAITPPVSGAVTGCGSDPITGNICCDAILLSDDMDGYCGNTGGYSGSDDSIADFCFFLENDSWLAFIATDTNVEIGIVHSNCNAGNGIQAMIYETTDCSNFTMVSNDCLNPGPTGSTSGTLTANNLTPGETYYLMIDGWNGDVCDYTLSIITGVLTTSASAEDATICAGQSTTLSANVFGVGPYTYAWTPAGSLDDPSIATPVATPGISTNYTVVISSPNGNVTESVEVLVDQANPGTASINGPNSVCENSSDVLYDAVSSNSTDYIWTVTGSAVIDGPADGATLVVDWGTTGGTVCMTPSNECGSVAEVCMNVSVVAAPDITATNPSNGCAPDCVNLASISINNNTGGIGPISFYNTFSDANNGVNMLPSPMVCTAGTYWVRMDTGINCFDVTSVMVTIEDPQIVTANPQPICSPGTIDLETDVFKNETNNWPGGTYSYYTDSLNAVNETNMLTNTAVSTSGIYWVRYETTSGCFDVASVNVSIEEAPSISADAPLYFCESQSVDISSASITDANNANVTVTNYFLTSAFAGLGWPALAMTSTTVTAPGTYYVRYETAADCWDTAHITVISTVTPSAMLSGGGGVCLGDNGILTFTMMGTPPYDVVYNNGTTDVTLTGISSPHDEVLPINSNTTFNIISVSDSGGCPGTFSGTASFTTNPVSTFEISGSTDVCDGEDAVLTFNLIGTGPFDVVYNDGSDIPLTGISNGHTITVSPTANTSYTPVSIVDASNCAGTVASGATVNILPGIQIQNLQEICNGANTNFTVTFELSGGDPSSYQVTGGGSFDFGSNTFTSNTIVSGGTYQFMVSDANCGPIEVSGAHACECTTEAGVMGTATNSQKLVCETATVTMNYDDGETLDADDVIYFVLHDSPGPGLGTVFMTNSSPVFTYAAVLDFEQTYYVSAVVGNDDGTGVPNMADPCLDISNTQAVTFYQETEASISAPDVICEGETAQFTFHFTGNSTYTVQYTDGTDDFTLTGITEGHTIDVTPTAAITYTITQVNNTGVPFCTGTVPTTGESATINLSQQPTIANLVEICDNQNVNYTVSFEIQGGVPAGYAVTGNSGNLVGNVFTSNPIPEGTTYNFTIEDGVCPSFDITGEHSCDCVTAVGTMGTTALLLCDDEVANAAYGGGETLDGDDAFGFILHDSAGAPLGNIIATSSTPQFSYTPAINYGVTYYISAVVGNDDGTGFPVLDQSLDPCLRISESQPVTFFTGTEMGINGASSICIGESANIVFTFNTPGTFDVEYTDGTSNFTLEDISNGYVLEVMPTQTTSYTLVAVSNHEAPFCPGEVTAGQDMVTVDVSEGPSIVNLVFECDDESINYTISFEITGGNAAGYTVVGLNGTLTGNAFVSDQMLGGTNYAFQVNDGGPCPVQENGQYACLCLPDMRAVITVDQIIGCGGESDGMLSVTNFSGTAPFTYVWSSGAIGGQANNLSVGWHYVTMTDTHGCTAVDSVYLDEPTPISAALSSVDPLCYDGSDGSITVSNVTGGSGVYEYDLNVLASFQGGVYTDLEAGNYVVSVSDDRGCSWVDSVLIINPAQFMVNTNEDMTIQLGDSVELEVFANAVLDTFYWSPQLPSRCMECLSQYVHPTQQTTFNLTAVSENGCVSTDRFSVIVSKENPIYIPNAFSPNGDGINDFLNVYPSVSVQSIKTFAVYTRWGALLHKQENFLPTLETMGWDGYFKGQQMSTDVYVYFVEIEYVDGTTQVISGDVTLIR